MTHNTMTLGEYAELYGEDFITADMLTEFDHLPEGSETLQVRPDGANTPGRTGHHRPGRRHQPPTPIGEYDAPCDADGGCPFRETCGTYHLACQTFYQWVQGPRLRPQYRAAHPVQLPCRDMYFKVFTESTTDSLPVPPLQYILNEEETVALNTIARRQRKVS